VHHLFDGLALLAAITRPLHILVALDWVRGRALRALMEWATRSARWPAILRSEALEIGPDGGPRNGGSAFRLEEAPRYRLRAFREAVDLLTAGRVLIVFPEGYPNVDPGFTLKGSFDEMLPFRPGFASLATLVRNRRGIEVPIVPVGLVYQPGPVWRVRVRFGEPLMFADGETLVRRVENRVAELSGFQPRPRLRRPAHLTRR
jgi:putative membrane protein